jgi:hypothetical protein
VLFPTSGGKRTPLSALPLWMFMEQAACGALLLATAVIIFRPTARSEL